MVSSPSAWCTTVTPRSLLTVRCWLAAPEKPSIRSTPTPTCWTHLAGYLRQDVKEPEKFPDLPRMGGLDLGGVLVSDYFFS
jgi:DNA-directed RNA polymerase